MLRNAFFALTIILIPSLTLAEFECSSNVSYTWKKTVEKPEKGERAEKTNPPEEKLEVHWRGLAAIGKDQEEAKARVIEAANLEKNKALKSCATEHQNVAGCVASKFEANSHTYNALGFSARKALEEAISKDCAAAQGVCIDATVSEPKCKEFVSAAASPSPSAAEEKEKGKAKK